MGREFVADDRGAASTDWVALTAGILILGVIVVISVMSNSSGYLMDEFDELNRQYEQDEVNLTELTKRPPPNQ